MEAGGDVNIDEIGDSCRYPGIGGFGDGVYWIGIHSSVSVYTL